MSRLGRLLDPVRAGHLDRIDKLEAEVKRLREEIDQHVPCAECIDEREKAEVEVERLREDYEAMRLEWSKSVDERDDALAEVERLRKDLEEWKGADLEARTPAYQIERLREAQATLTSVRVWAEIVEARHSDERVQRFARMLLDLLDGDAPDITASTTEGEQ